MFGEERQAIIFLEFFSPGEETVYTESLKCHPPRSNVAVAPLLVFTSDDTPALDVKHERDSNRT